MYGQGKSIYSFEEEKLTYQILRMLHSVLRLRMYQLQENDRTRVIKLWGNLLVVVRAFLFSFP